MIISGDKLKKYRKTMKFSQSELANGICPQIVISKLENQNFIPRMNIINGICEKLMIDVSDICIGEDGNDILYSNLEEVMYLCDKYEYEKAYEFFCQNMDYSLVNSDYEKKSYYYYKGITELLGKEDIENAIKSFEAELRIGNGKIVSFLDVQSTNALGIAYYQNNRKDLAEYFFDKSVQDLELVEEINDHYIVKTLKILNNCANYYSKESNYSKALELCDIAIDMAKNENIVSQLDKLYYEKAFSLVMTNRRGTAVDYFFLALAFAESNNNFSLVLTIKNDMKDFNLSFKEKLV